jgi:predicted nuclease of predicted toxin-antitoxin system
LSLSIILDENVAPEVVPFLLEKRPGWKVVHVRDVGLRGASDHTIFEWAQREGFIVITFDEDFADARMYPAGTHAGVIRLRVWPTTVEACEEALDRLLSAVSDVDLAGSLVIVDDVRIRVRRGARHG